MSIRPVRTAGWGLLLACGGSGDPTGAPPPPPPPPAPVIATIRVAPATVAPGGSIPRVARAEDAAGAVVSTSFVWTSEASGIATVSPAGVVTGAAPGSATIRAAAGGKSGSATITVADLGWATLPQPNFSTCGLTIAGELYCWGSATGGIGGPSADTDHESCTESDNEWCYTTPRRLAFPQQFTSLAVGRTHSCGLTAAGDAWCWGSNDVNQLGAATSESCSFPGLPGPALPCSRQPLAVGGGHQFVALVANRHTCGLTALGEAWCWGQNDHGQLGSIPTTAPSSAAPVRAAGALLFNSLAAGYLHTCGIGKDGVTYCWGDEPALGSTRAEGPQATPVGGGHQFAMISAGDAETCGLTAEGAAWCWGWGGQGQLGNGATQDVTTPVAVNGGHSFTRVSVGHFYACGLDGTGKAWCWGLNSYGSLGIGGPGPVVCGDGTCATSPVAVAGGLSFTAIEAGNWVTCGLSTAGRGFCWGRNTFGGLGNGRTDGEYRQSPGGVAGALP